MLLGLSPPEIDTMVHFGELFLDQASFSFSHSLFDSVDLLLLSIYSVEQPLCHDRRKFLKPESMYFIIARSFPVSVPLYYSKIVLLPLHPIVRVTSCILHLVVGRLFFRYFGKSCFVCIARPYLGIFEVYYYLLLFLVFHTSVSRWFLTKVSVTTSLLKSQGLFSVF